MPKKTSQIDLDKAIALFRNGKSTRECEKLTGVNYKKVEREAKKRCVKKGDVSHLAPAIAESQSEFVALPVSVQEVVSRNVSEINENKKIDDYLNKAIGLAAKRSVALLQDEDSTMMDIVGFGKFQLDAKKGLGTLKEPAANNQKEEKTINNVMKVPLASDDWERAAIDSQSKLVNEQ